MTPGTWKDSPTLFEKSLGWLGFAGGASALPICLGLPAAPPWAAVVYSLIALWPASGILGGVSSLLGLHLGRRLDRVRRGFSPPRQYEHDSSVKKRLVVGYATFVLTMTTALVVVLGLLAGPPQGWTFGEWPWQAISVGLALGASVVGWAGNEALTERPMARTDSNARQ